MEAPHDCVGVARIRSACFPSWPVTAEEMAAAEARRLPERLHMPWVAVDDISIVGYGYVEEPGVAARPGRLRIRVLIDPARRRRGAGRALYDALFERALEAGATELVTEARADESDAHRFLLGRGFVEYHRRIESRLQLAAVDPAAVARAIDAHTDAFLASGVRIATYRQLQLAYADAPRRLYDLDSVLWVDVPFGLSGSVPTFEDYRTNHDPALDAIVAYDPARFAREVLATLASS